MIYVVARALETSQTQDIAQHKYRIFPSGIFVEILLPSNAPPVQVALEGLKLAPEHLIRSLAESDPLKDGSPRVLRVRKVRIQSPEYESAFPDSDPLFTAVLMDTSIGQVLELLQYETLETQDRPGFWKHWTIYPNRLLNQVSLPASEPLLRSGECLLIQFTDRSVYENRIVIDPTGDISLPYVGKLHVAGMTLQQARQAIVTAYQTTERRWKISVVRCP